MMDTNLTIKSASDFQQAQVRNKIGFAVAKKAIDAQRQQGESAVQLIQQAEQLSQKASQQIAHGRIDVLL